MAKIKKVTSVNTQKVSKLAETYVTQPKAKKTKKKNHNITVWDHHDTMIVNLRMWVEKTIENLNNDIKTHAPELAGKSKLKVALNKAQELNIQLWDHIRTAQELANSHKEI